MTDIKNIIIETANRRDLTFAQNFNGRAYALMDINWIGYFDTLDEVLEFLDISVEIDEDGKELQGMTISEYNDHCGDCKVADYCDEPYSDIHLCCNPGICDMSPEKFKKLYNDIQCKHPKWSKRKILKFLTNVYGAESEE